MLSYCFLPAPLASFLLLVFWRWQVVVFKTFRSSQLVPLLWRYLQLVLQLQLVGPVGAFWFACPTLTAGPGAVVKLLLLLLPWWHLLLVAKPIVVQCRATAGLPVVGSTVLLWLLLQLWLLLLRPFLQHTQCDHAH